MTDTAKLAIAVSEMQKAGLTVDEWCMRVSKGGYRYMSTHIYKSLKAFEAAVKTPPAPAPKPPQANLSDIQRCLFLTNDVSKALDTTNRLLIATADKTYRASYSDLFIREAIAQNRFRVWCDCHSTYPPTAFEWLDQLGLPHHYFYGECESAQAFTVAYEAGSRHMVGNLSVLTYDSSLQPHPVTNQLAYVMNGSVHVTNETYYNRDPNYRVDWRNANAGVGGNCMAVYESSSEPAHYFSLQDQHAQGKYNPNTDCVYVAGFAQADWDFVVTH